MNLHALDFLRIFKIRVIGPFLVEILVLKEVMLDQCGPSKWKLVVGGQNVPFQCWPGDTKVKVTQWSTMMSSLDHRNMYTPQTM